MALSRPGPSLAVGASVDRGAELDQGLLQRPDALSLGAAAEGALAQATRWSSAWPARGGLTGAGLGGGGLIGWGLIGVRGWARKGSSVGKEVAWMKGASRQSRPSLFMWRK